MLPNEISDKPVGAAGPFVALFVSVPATIGLLFLTWLSFALRGWGDGAGGYTPTCEGTWFPTLCVSALLALNLYAAFKTQSKATRSLAIILILLGAFPTLTTIGYFLDGIPNSIRIHRYQQEHKRETLWLDTANLLAPLLLDFVQAHPDSIHFTGDHDRITVDNFEDLAVAKYPTLTLKNGHLRDPWGHDIEYAMDLKKEGMLRIGDATYGCWTQYGNKIAVGVYSPGNNSDPYDKYASYHWVIKTIPNEKPTTAAR